MTASLTATFDAANHRVSLVASGLNASTASTTLVRWDGAEPQTAPNAFTVRAGNLGAVTSGTVQDYEYTDLAIEHYQLSCYDSLGVVLLNPVDVADGTFETGVADWSGTGCSIAQSAAQHHSGSFSLLLTVVGTPANAFVRPLLAKAAPVAPGSSCTASMWVYYPAGGVVQAVIDWYDSGGTYLSTSSTGATVPAATWTRIVLAAVAPAGAASAEAGPTLSGSPAAGTTLYVDDVTVASSVLSATVTPDNGGVPLLRSVFRPYLNRVVTVADFTAISYSGRGTVFDVLGASAPVAITDVLSQRSFGLTLVAANQAEETALALFFAPGDVVRWDPPGTAQGALLPAAGYAYVSGVQDSRRSTYGAHRYFDVSLVEVTRPDPAVPGFAATWAGVVSGYPSWSAVESAFASWTSLEAMINPTTTIVA